MRRRRYDTLAAKAMRPTVPLVSGGGRLQYQIAYQCFGVDPMLYVLPDNVSNSGIVPQVGPTFGDSVDIDEDDFGAFFLDGPRGVVLNGAAVAPSGSIEVGTRDLVFHGLFYARSKGESFYSFRGRSSTSNAFHLIFIGGGGSCSFVFLNGAVSFTQSHGISDQSLVFCSAYVDRDHKISTLVNGEMEEDEIGLFGSNWNTSGIWHFGQSSRINPFPHALFFSGLWLGDNIITSQADAIADHNSRWAAILGDGSQVVHRMYSIGKSGFNRPNWSFTDLDVNSDTEVYCEQVGLGMVCCASDVPRVSSRGLEVHPAKDYLLAPTQETISDDWTASEVAVSDFAGDSPDGLHLATSVTCSGVDAVHSLSCAVTVSPETEYTFSLCLRKIGAHTTRVSVEFNFVSSTEIEFDLGGETDNVAVRSVDIGGGWYRYVMRWTSGASDGAGTVVLNVFGLYDPS